MYKLSHILKEKRNAIPFDSKDISYTFDENKNIIDINKQKNNDAMNIIEEFMILLMYAWLIIVLSFLWPLLTVFMKFQMHIK